MARDVSSITSEILLSHIMDLESGKIKPTGRNYVSEIEARLVDLDEKQRNRIKEILLRPTKSKSDAREILNIVREQKELIERQQNVQAAQNELVSKLYQSNFLAGLIGSIAIEFTRSIERGREEQKEEEEFADQLNRKTEKPERISTTKLETTIKNVESSVDEVRTDVSPLAKSADDRLAVLKKMLDETARMRKRLDEFTGKEDKRAEDEAARLAEERLEKKKPQRVVEERQRASEPSKESGIDLTSLLIGGGLLGAAGPLLRTVSTIFKKAFLPAAIAFSAFEFFKGFSGAEGILNKKDVSLPERLKAGIANSISGMFLGLFSPKNVVNFFDKMGEVFSTGIEMMLKPFKNTWDSMQELFIKFKNILGDLVDTFFGWWLDLNPDKLKNFKLDDFIPEIPSMPQDLALTDRDIPTRYSLLALQKEDEQNRANLDKSVPEKVVSQPKQESPAITKAKQGIRKLTGLGETTIMSESGKGGAGTIAPDTGGTTSYGILQLNTGGELPKFLKASPYGEKFKGLQPGSPEFNERWKQVAVEDPEGFAKAQLNYAIEKQYKPFVAELEKDIPGISEKGLASQEALLATVNQYGTIAPSVVKKAFEGKDVKNMTDEQFINILQMSKIMNIPTNFRKAIAEDPTVATQMEQRFRDESKQYKSLIKSEQQPQEVKKPETVSIESTKTNGVAMIQKSSENYSKDMMSRNALPSIANTIVNNMVGGGSGKEVGSGHKGVVSSRPRSSAYMRAIQGDFATV